jgi:ribonucleoside-diphosphate reductase alpha chain
MSRFLTKKGTSPLASVAWETRDARITDSKNTVVFEQFNVRVPTTWSQTALNIAASKYLHGNMDGGNREKGVDDLFLRVTNAIHDSGVKQGYFVSKEDASIFRDELVHLLVNQYAAFNSPVFFNAGCAELEPENKGKNWHWSAASLMEDRAHDRLSHGSIVQEPTGYRNPQCSACFINSVEDSMESILDLAKTEGMLFKWGSGSGSNLSVIRSSKELLSGGGTSSGPLSFMRGFDAFAGVIKSGGKTRRAAKMVILNADHPDIEEFIDCKTKEEAKARTLVSAGYDGSGPDSEAYSSIFYQNANNSVRVTDEFMELAASGKPSEWPLIARTTGAVVSTVDAGDLLRKLSKATYDAGDPGMQFDTTINTWHTCPESGRINASNPCSEYMFLDDTACNLASFNLLQYLQEDGSFNVELFSYHVRLLIIAQDILVDMAGYPTEGIARNSHDFRPLGLGYANLGALLLHKGLPYDSDEGRGYAAAITAVMGGGAYLTSAELAEVMPVLNPANRELDSYPNSTGAFPAYSKNSRGFKEVISRHLAAALLLNDLPKDQALADAAVSVWSKAQHLGSSFGYRNAQVTVLAPTGTIGFLMDADTTGVEPMLGLIVYKKMVGGGYMTLVNQSVSKALEALGYGEDEVASITQYIEEHGTIEGAIGVLEEHLPIFDCALKPAKGNRTISWRGHVDMMAAVQPFLSGAISKTVNMPTESTVEDISQAYIWSWKQGLKAIAIYRDGSKSVQVVSVSKDEKKDEKKEEPKDEKKDEKKEEPKDNQLFAPLSEPEEAKLAGPPKADRHRLPSERRSITHKFGIAGHEGYITAGLYPNDDVGEIFIRMAKEGSTISGLMDSLATSVSMGLQSGVPLKAFCDKFSHTRFEPSGWTGSEQLGYATSLVDYIFRWLELRFLKGEQLNLYSNLSPLAASAEVSLSPAGDNSNPMPLLDYGDAPTCPSCGEVMRRAGKCFSCSCGQNLGGCS